jgi:hypothetical protein
MGTVIVWIPQKLTKVLGLFSISTFQIGIVFALLKYILNNFIIYFYFSFY